MLVPIENKKGKDMEFIKELIINFLKIFSVFLIIIAFILIVCILPQIITEFFGNPTISFFLCVAAVSFLLALVGTIMGRSGG